MSITLFGIKNCDTIKKARKWLDANNIECRFHDFRTDGLPEALLDQWFATLGWELSEFEVQQSREERDLIVLVTHENDFRAGVRKIPSPLQSSDRLADPGGATEHCEVACADPTADRSIDERKPDRHRLPFRRARAGLRQHV